MYGYKKPIARLLHNRAIARALYFLIKCDKVSLFFRESQVYHYIKLYAFTYKNNI